jgi:hypothetical protein
MASSSVSVSQIKSYTFLPMVAGVAAAVTTAGFSGDSRLLSIVRNTLGGTAGVPATSVVTPSAAGASSVWGIGVFSSNAADTSVYTVYWSDDIQQSNYFPVASGPAAVGQLYSP